MILVIDNYDSFTFNLVQLLGSLMPSITVIRNDEIDPAGIEQMAPDRIVISPGPGRPERAGVTLDVIRRFSGKVPILGVCLGHQAIGMAFGGKVVHAPTLMHGKISPIVHDGKSIYRGLASPFDATRYHSLVVSCEGLPDSLVVTARTEDGTIMGIRHATFPVEGVQFHPESIMTLIGLDLLRNWLKVQ